MTRYVTKILKKYYKQLTNVTGMSHKMVRCIELPLILIRQTSVLGFAVELKTKTNETVNC